MKRVFFDWDTVGVPLIHSDSCMAKWPESERD